MLLELVICGLHVLHGACQTAQFKTDWDLVKVFKNFYSLFKKSRAKLSDYLEENDLQESHESKSTAYLFPLKYCEHRWFENGKAINRLIDIQPYLKLFLEHLTENKKFPNQDNRFPFLKSVINPALLPAVLEFSLCVIT